MVENQLTLVQLCAAFLLLASGRYNLSDSTCVTLSLGPLVTRLHHAHVAFTRTCTDMVQSRLDAV